ncbi:hypothetical protein [Streptomyces albipurpureus]|uniref:hypothetical protein n=1 Tax=Streptomyces albipurpureus TaxID=2897419 RepID=UPI002033D31D|nr:hypothetical protein [Streptomyces sp. CWNU-1]
MLIQPPREAETRQCDDREHVRQAPPQGPLRRRSHPVRSALHAAGVDLNTLGPEPGWFAAARAGRTVPLIDADWAELVAHLGSATTASVTSDEACGRAVARIEAVTVLREGMTVQTCGKLPSADALRAVRQAVREAQLTHAKQQPGRLPEAH